MLLDFVQTGAFALDSTILNVLTAILVAMNTNVVNVFVTATPTLSFSRFQAMANLENKVITPVNINIFNSFLDGFDMKQRAILVNGFSCGFSLTHSINMHLSQNADFPPNHSSITRNEIIAEQMLMKELRKGRISGPFDAKPLPHFHISPLGLVDKSDGKFRMIHDLSFPKHESVNDGIIKENSKVLYENIDTCVDIEKNMKPGALMAKVDIEEAFRIIPIQFSDRHLLGMHFKGHFYYDNCLPMGASSSCKIFETFSRAIQFILNERIRVNNVSHILDDFLLAGPAGSSLCSNTLHYLLYVCHSCGIPK